MERRGFYIFNIDTPQDEIEAIAALLRVGITGAEVMARERVERRVYVEYDHTRPLPVDIREQLYQHGVMV